MQQITISGNSRFKILQDFNNNLFDKKYMKINSNGHIELQIFNKGESYSCNYKMLKSYKTLDTIDDKIIYNIIYNNHKPFINIVYNIKEFIPYYIIYPQIDGNDNSVKYLANNCENILNIFMKSIDKSSLETIKAENIKFDFDEFIQISDNNDLIMYNIDEINYEYIYQDKNNQIKSLYNYIKEYNVSDDIYDEDDDLINEYDIDNDSYSDYEY